MVVFFLILVFPSPLSWLGMCKNSKIKFFVLVGLVSAIATPFLLALHSGFFILASISQPYELTNDVPLSVKCKTDKIVDNQSISHLSSVDIFPLFYSMFLNVVENLQNRKP